MFINPSSFPSSCFGVTNARGLSSQPTAFWSPFSPSTVTSIFKIKISIEKQHRRTRIFLEHYLFEKFRSHLFQRKRNVVFVAISISKQGFGDPLSESPNIKNFGRRGCEDPVFDCSVGETRFKKVV